MLVGPNNAGKSNLLAAVRAFYESGIKYDPARDFPKFGTDQESWVEIEYEVSDDEAEQLKAEYVIGGKRFRVRKYFESDQPDDEGKPRTGIYAYVNGTLSGSRFYGAKNVQQGKLGEVIYVPAVSKLDDHTKLTGPSALRDLLTIVLRGVLGSSPSYLDLSRAFDEFESKLKKEQSPEGRSLEQLERDISAAIERWGTKFEISVASVSPDEIIKSLVGHQVIDAALNQALDATAFGQGFQRQLIFALIGLAAAYAPPRRPSSKKEFAPTLTWLLFEEPEAFLHPTQCDLLHRDLRRYAASDGQQVTVCSHSPHFASLSVEDLPSIIRVTRPEAETHLGQLTVATLPTFLAANQVCIDELKEVGVDVTAEDETIEMESIKYALWLNPSRSALFFAEHVVLVEGASEAALVRFLVDRGDLTLSGGLAVIDTLGKWNTHRFMSLLGALHIPHSVLVDGDGGSARATVLDRAIRRASNPSTMAIDSFDVDLERFLDVKPCARKDRKPQYLMWLLREGHIANGRIAALCEKVQRLAQPPTPAGGAVVQGTVP